MTVQDFIKFWNEARGDRLDHNPAKKLALAYRKCEHDLELAGSEVLTHLKPVNSGKAWHIGFQKKSLEGIADLAQRIDSLEIRSDQIEKDIEAVVSIQGGPVFKGLEDVTKTLSTKVERAGVKARAAATRAAMEVQNQNKTAAEIAQDPDVVIAEASLKEIREKVGVELEGLRDKVA